MDLNNLISGIAKSGIASGFAGGLAGGALGSALMSRKGRKVAGTAATVGGIAALGGLAWKAWQSYQERQPQASPPLTQGEAALAPCQPPGAASGAPTREGFEVDADDPSEGGRGLLLVRAMIAAAKADGHMDAAEKQRIFQRVGELVLSGEEKALLFDELSGETGIDRIVGAVGDVETAVEVYAASVFAIDSTRNDGAVYLQRLADRLGLPRPLVEEIHAQTMMQRRAA